MPKDLEPIVKKAYSPRNMHESFELHTLVEAACDLFRDFKLSASCLESGVAAILAYATRHGYLNGVSEKEVLSSLGYSEEDFQRLLGFLESNKEMLSLKFNINAFSNSKGFYFREGSPVFELKVEYGWTLDTVYAQFYCDGKVVFYHYTFLSFRRHEFFFGRENIERIVKSLKDIGFLSLKNKWEVDSRDDDIFTLIFNEGGVSKSIEADSYITELPDFPAQLKLVLDELGKWVRVKRSSIISEKVLSENLKADAPGKFDLS